MVTALSTRPAALQAAPEVEARQAPIAVRTLPPVDGDLVRSYLRDIGRVPLLTHEQEITLGRQVQDL
ncbi:sigma-70 factor domain-containing protein, partial [Synechococcus sp. 1G10]|uniref:sigma-70 factor domain-containing protein n=1 Tax=Synechococcus sp. 1G10 TaxID=2025605 RepID=UPI0026F44E92